MICFINSSYTLIIIGVILVLLLIPTWLVLSKSGQHGYAALVPIWNFTSLLNASGKPWWWIFYFTIPVVGFPICWIIMLFGLSKRFGKNLWYTLGLILLFPVFFVHLGLFGKYRESQNSNN